jgi:ABC-type transport system involved in multi-copper enzyme maturation permease subunit
VIRPAYIYEIARFTLLEAVSRRLILAGVAISLGYIGLFALGFHFAYDRSLDATPNPQQRVGLGVAYAILTVFGVYVVNYLASFLALFLSVGAVSSEIDSGTLHAVLARPLARSEFILGRWLGYAVLLSGYVLAMSAMVLLVARLIAGHEVPDPVPALLLMLLECVLLLTLSMLGSTFMPTLANGIVTFTLLGLAWLAGIMEVIGRLLARAANQTASDALIGIGTIVSLVVPSDALWRGASYFLQPPILIAAMSSSGGGGIPFFSIEPPTVPLIVWSVGYVAVVLAAAVGVFGRRDL